MSRYLNENLQHVTFQIILFHLHQLEKGQPFQHWLVSFLDLSFFFTPYESFPPVLTDGLFLEEEEWQQASLVLPDSSEYPCQF